MKQSSSIFRRLKYVAVIGICSILTNQAHCESQDNAIGLNKIVEIKSGIYTLDAVCREISLQTGLNVVPVAYLKLRTFTLAIGQMKAKDALDMICDLNHLSMNMRESKVGNSDSVHVSYEIVRKVPGNVQNLSQVSTAVRSLIPRDIQTYCNLDKLESSDDMVRVSSRFMNRPDNIPRLDPFAKEILSFASKKFATQPEILFSDFSPANRRNLSALHLFKNFESTADVLWDFFGPHLFEPGTLEIDLENEKMMNISGRDVARPGQKGVPLMTGFGKNVKIRE